MLLRFSTIDEIDTNVVKGSWGSKGGDSWTTDVVTAYTTYCPEATEITHGGQTWTATEATTLTVCPGGCTVSSPVAWTTTPVAYTTPVESSPVESTPVVYTTAPTTWETSVAPPPTSAPPAPYPVGNTTVPYSTAAPGRLPINSFSLRPRANPP